MWENLEPDEQGNFHIPSYFTSDILLKVLCRRLEKNRGRRGRMYIKSEILLSMRGGIWNLVSEEETGTTLSQMVFVKVMPSINQPTNQSISCIA